MLDIQFKSNQWKVKRASDPGSVLLLRPALLGKTGISLQLQPRVCHVTCLTYLIISSWPCALNIGAADAEQSLPPPPHPLVSQSVLREALNYSFVSNQAVSLSLY